MGQDAGLAYRRIHFRQETGRYRAHNIRYFGVASPAGKHQFSSAVFTLPGEEQKPRPKRLSFEAMSVKYLISNLSSTAMGSACEGWDGYPVHSLWLERHRSSNSKLYRNHPRHQILASRHSGLKSQRPSRENRWGFLSLYAYG
jgi:hypothetical protein